MGGVGRVWSPPTGPTPPLQLAWAQNSHDFPGSGEFSPLLPSAPGTEQALVRGVQVPDMNKRVTMNWLLLGAIGLPVTALAGP